MMFVFLHLLLNSYGTSMYVNASPIDGPDLEPARYDKPPFVVFIMVKRRKDDKLSRHECTGALVSKNHVLTAAHCLNDMGRGEILQVVAGAPSLRLCEPPCEVESWITYSKWAREKCQASDPLMDDVAILKLAKKVDCKMKLPSLSKKKFEQLAGLDARVTGWHSHFTMTSSMYLVFGTVKIYNKKLCQSKLTGIPGLDCNFCDIYLCVKGEPSHVLIEKVEDGGPLILGKDEIVGIFNGKQAPELPGTDQISFFISMHHFRSFIKDQI
ncbi:hypothetical protein QAD02_005139 [Eretmocerus hayati]|uniref:Uncharacterized protein n=1 Tax=Eretmocerus hayati TaxID=131215 RepID=A0ACC2NS14_9HYME|nr:hypothetical protein QAD02_005139 [Eretmocerus hayati]